MRVVTLEELMYFCN